MFSAFINVRSWLSTGVTIVGLAIGASAFADMAIAREKDAIVIGMGVSPTVLDPTIAAPVSIGQVVWQNVFEGLVAIDRDGRIVPQLAKSWYLSEDGLTYEFDLQSGVKFHDGSAFDAKSAKFTLDRARGEASTNPQKRFFAAIKSVEAPSDTKLVVQLSERNGSFLYQLGWPSSVMVSEASAENNKTTPIGTGPYRFVSWAKGYQIELQRSEDYWDKAAVPVIAKATFRFVNDAQAQAAALKAGDIDAFPEFAAPEMMSEFEGDPRLGVYIGDTELKVVAGLNNARKPFDDIRVRQALMMAIDRKTVVDGAWSGYGTPIGSHFTPNNSYFRDMTAAIPYNVERAKELLAEAGHPDGFTMTIKAPQMPYAQRSAQVLQAMLAEVGVTLNIETSEFPAQWISDVFTNGNFDMTIVAHAEPMDIDIYARNPYYFNYNNEDFRTTIKNIASTSDEGERTTLYGKAQEILAHDVPALFLFVMPKLGVWDKKLEGLWLNEPIPSNVLRDVRWTD
jgi:peptide/nickel transport system substrate-binding protein